MPVGFIGALRRPSSLACRLGSLSHPEPCFVGIYLLRRSYFINTGASIIFWSKLRNSFLVSRSSLPDALDE